MKPDTSPTLTTARRPLHRQFVRMLLLPLTLAFVVAATGTILISYGAELSAQKTYYQQTIDIFAQSLSKPLWDCDSTTVDGIVETLAYLSRVSGVQLHNICANNLVTLGNELSGATQGPDRLQTSVLYHDEMGRNFTVGYLDVQFHSVSLLSAAMTVLWRYLMIFVVMLAVMMAGAALVFHKTVSMPLSRFRHAIKGRISKTKPIAADILSIQPKNDELGDVIHAYAELMAEQELRFRRQETLALCASKLLTTSALNKQQVQDVLTNVLEELSVDYIYLTTNSNGNTICVTRSDTPDVNTVYQPRYTRWTEQFSIRKRIVSSSPRFPATERDDLHAHGVLSMAAFPVWGQDHLYGYIGIQDNHQDRLWSDSEQIFLQTIADMVGAFLENEKHTFELATAINQLRDNEKILQATARRDPLTGLGNRIELEDALSHAVARAERNRQEGHVLLIDLDDFKPVNDQYGHAAGDFALQAIAQRLLAVVRRTDTVIRIGGDEFVIIIAEGQPGTSPTALIDKLADAIAAPILYNDHTLQVNASIGIACYPTDGSTSLTLLAHADKAMYDIKKTRKTIQDLVSTHRKTI